MALLWRKMLAEWRQCMQACRDALRKDGEHAAASILQIRARILTFLLRRYQDMEREPGAMESTQDSMLTARRNSVIEDADFLYGPRPPDVRPSRAFGPWGGRVLGAAILDISRPVNDSRRKRCSWWFW